MINKKIKEQELKSHKRDVMKKIERQSVCSQLDKWKFRYKNKKWTERAGALV